MFLVVVHSNMCLARCAEGIQGTDTCLHLPRKFVDMLIEVVTFEVCLKA